MQPLDSLKAQQRAFHLLRLAARHQVKLRRWPEVPRSLFGIWSNESYVALRAKRASREKFLDALKQVPDVEPPDFDRLPENYKPPK